MKISKLIKELKDIEKLLGKDVEVIIQNEIDKTGFLKIKKNISISNSKKNLISKTVTDKSFISGNHVIIKTEEIK